MKFGSLFSGIGGLDLGLERAGMTCSWQVEIDPFCTKVLNKHWPHVPKFGDIRNVGKQNIETVDLIAGGFPCQPFSVAGKRRGTEDDRHLWPEMLRVISELRPTWVIAENVPGIIPIFLYQALFDLAREGYEALPIVLPACGFDAPHLRYRLFIIAYDVKGRRERKGVPVRSRRQDKTQTDISGSGKVLAYANRGFGQLKKKALRPRGDPPELGGEYVSDSDSKRSQKREGQNTKRAGENKRTEFDRGGGEPRLVPNAKQIGRDELEPSVSRGEERKGASDQAANGGITGGRARWLPEPGVGRVADGFPGRVDRLKSLGNAVVPQVAEHIGRMIMNINNLVN